MCTVIELFNNKWYISINCIPLKKMREKNTTETNAKQKN